MNVKNKVSLLQDLGSCGLWKHNFPSQIRQIKRRNYFKNLRQILSFRYFRLYDNV